MKKGRYPLLIVLLCALCMLLGIFIGRNQRDDYVMLIPDSPHSGVSVEQGTPNYLLDINTATVLQLQELPGIGETLAERIVKYRETFGLFQSIDELTNVEGIGDKKLLEIETLIRVGG